MAQNAMTAASPVDTEHIQEKAVEAKTSMRELVYNTSAAVSNAILVTLGYKPLRDLLIGRQWCKWVRSQKSCCQLPLGLRWRHK